MVRRYLKRAAPARTKTTDVSLFLGDGILTHGSSLRRGLIYHCYPLATADWRANCFDVWRYRSVFNGRVVVTITYGPECEDSHTVVEWFDHHGGVSDYHFVANDKRRGLNVSFREQLRRVRSESGIVFKAHTKGITHEDDPIYGSRHWRQNMARGCLRDIDLVEQKFRDGYFSFSTFRTTTTEGANIMGQLSGPVRDPWPGWHYPGAFYWFDPQRIPDRVFALPEHYYENEAFPCHLGPIETGVSLMPDNFNFWQEIAHPKES